MAKVSLDKALLAKLWPEFTWDRIPRKQKKQLKKEVGVWLKEAVIRQALLVSGEEKDVV